MDSSVSSDLGALPRRSLRDALQDICRRVFGRAGLANESGQERLVIRRQLRGRDDIFRFGVWVVGRSHYLNTMLE